ncbi:FkbM family methyltransferase [Planctomycetota bacterium]|nr:FkbM family methyltransferase [Planctomycetota bacterium]
MKAVIKNLLYKTNYKYWLDNLVRKLRDPQFARRLDEESVFYRKHICVPSDGLIFDVGVNRGFKSVLFRQMGASVVGIEPLPECIDELDTRFSKDPHYKLVSKALGDSAGTAQLRRADVSAMCSMSDAWVDLGRTNKSDYIEVEVTTLDQLIEQYGEPDFCKIDVEGYEPEVLAGLNTGIKNLSFEFTPIISKLGISCINHLESLGTYEYNKSAMDSGDMKLDFKEWLDAEAMTKIMLEMEAATEWQKAGDIYARRVA